MYVDDILTGGNTLDEVKQIRRKIQRYYFKKGATNYMREVQIDQR